VTAAREILLINPTITSARSARFPLAVMSLSAALSGRYRSTLIDGNVDRDFITTTVNAVGRGSVSAVGVSVMGGPQLPTAIAVSKAIRAKDPRIPIVWGGHFPTICPRAVLNAPYVDYAVRGQGEDTLGELLDALAGDRTDERFAAIAGLTWRHQGEVVSNCDRHFSAASFGRSFDLETLPDPGRYLSKTFLGRRTAGYQAALGCRFRCTFCGVAAMFRGKTALPPAARLDRDLELLRSKLGADAIQFYDHNFFDREVDMIPLLEVLAKHALPWWCFARSDALLNMSDRAWALVRKSRLRMAYIGAESPSDWLLHELRKGTRSDQTLAAVEKCRSQGVIPELSFMLAPPQAPEEETERTFEFIREVKCVHPGTEIMLYVYTPLPVPPSARPKHGAAARAPTELRDCQGATVAFPTTADEWAQPRWRAYWCHTDAPWLTERLRRRLRDFTTVLGCRFPTITDIRSPALGKAALRTLASWRYRYRRYDRPWELDWSSRLIRLWDPRASSL
jgi:anaerobic magnesium-protoporphyrin IX monomethyl ester cyclase